MTNRPSLQAVLEVSSGKVNAAKLRLLTQKLELAIDGPLDLQPVDDPIVIRRKLVAKLKQQGASAGSVQALEQFFMGIVRRAAVDGIIQAPPEGPWTRSWQAVLESSDRNKSQIRILAAWATDQSIEPSELNQQLLRDFASRVSWNDETISVIASQVNGSGGKTRGGCSLTARLKLKAEHGSVKPQALK